MKTIAIGFEGFLEKRHPDASHRIGDFDPKALQFLAGLRKLQGVVLVVQTAKDATAVRDFIASKDLEVDRVTSARVMADAYVEGPLEDPEALVHELAGALDIQAFEEEATTEPLAGTPEGLGDAHGRQKPASSGRSKRRS